MKKQFLLMVIGVISLGFMSFTNADIRENSTFENNNFEIVILEEEVSEIYDCGVGCTATATNSETGESYSFYSYVIASNCATAQSIACGQAYAQALNFVANHK
ncbi:hypothetical protein [Robiginitalea marina]|uniref:Uncharacterized protein n=1 Tax=Robiginitalea marina TaxID=2954105 RepID=A0ABT1AYB2_9FLAO|nr:hypothetical protein [Robiginitalea marina]MCO5724986.1 hypothetical protein [Robiginitalea marina]